MSQKRNDVEFYNVVSLSSELTALAIGSELLNHCFT